MLHCMLCNPHGLFKWGSFRPYTSSKFENEFHFHTVNCINDSEEAPSVNSILSHHSDHDVPPIVTELIHFLKKRALDVEVCSGKAPMSAASVTVGGERIDFKNDPEYVDNHYVACIHASVLLKTFLRSSSEPVTTNVLYPRLLALAEIPKKEKIPAVQEFVVLLPRPIYLLLQKVVQFLTILTSYLTALPFPFFAIVKTVAHLPSVPAEFNRQRFEMALRTISF